MTNQIYSYINRKTVFGGIQIFEIYWCCLKMVSFSINYGLPTLESNVLLKTILICSYRKFITFEYNINLHILVNQAKDGK